MNKNRYGVCLKHLADKTFILKDARCFIDAKQLEEQFPDECMEIRKAMRIKYEGI